MTDENKKIPHFGPGSNTGHGHIWERPDGMKTRCGGPRWCEDCKGHLHLYG